MSESNISHIYDFSKHRLEYLKHIQYFAVMFKPKSVKCTLRNKKLMKRVHKKYDKDLMAR